MSLPTIKVIGELMNNAYARARKAWETRDVAGYQHLAQLQTAGGASILNLNIDGTQRLSVTQEEMLAFLPTLVPAIQAATTTPISFDNPNLDYHRAAMAVFDPAKSSGKPVYNSLAASRRRLDEMIAFIKEHDMRCIVMASEKFSTSGGSETAFTPEETLETVRIFVDRLVSEADRTTDDILVDPGLAPVAADTYGLINLGIDTMRLCRADPHLKGLHFVVGLSNFSFGLPKAIRDPLERAYLTIAGRAGLDHALANVERNATPLPEDDPMVAALEEVLAAGRALPGESAEDAGYRQTDKIMELCAAHR
ncbi:MAG: dihydropteroate synthase [Opitutaceae bacterium]|nr:dihydropteroate synthase [Opitutaceae bacterium]